MDITALGRGCPHLWCLLCNDTLDLRRLSSAPGEPVFPQLGNFETSGYPILEPYIEAIKAGEAEPPDELTDRTVNEMSDILQTHMPRLYKIEKVRGHGETEEEHEKVVEGLRPLMQRILDRLKAAQRARSSTDLTIVEPFEIYKYDLEERILEAP